MEFRTRGGPGSIGVGAHAAGRDRTIGFRPGELRVVAGERTTTTLAFTRRLPARGRVYEVITGFNSAARMHVTAHAIVVDALPAG